MPRGCACVALRVLISTIFTIGITQTTCAEDTLIIDSPACIQDAALLDGEFARWNFGASPYLEVGRMVGIYAEHSAVTLVHVDIRDITFGKITEARLFVYKPRSFTQLRPVNIALYQISHRDTPWQEGRGFAEPANSSASWERDKEILKSATFLDMQPARDDAGHWLIFHIPVALVERWIAHSEGNAGLCLTLAPEKNSPPIWGDHVYINSSEHFDGNGPRLVITGEKLRQSKASTLATIKKTPFRLPLMDSKFSKWQRSSKRLPTFARNANMTQQQARLFYYFDTEVREKFILSRYQEPLGRLREELLKNLAARDERATRTTLAKFREGLLAWEYIRETLWYTSGPLAEYLSSAQLSQLYAGSMWTKLENRSNAASRERAAANDDDAGETPGVWMPLDAETLRKRQNEVLQRIVDNTRPATEQIAKLTPLLFDYVRLENEHTAHFRKHLDACRADNARTTPPIDAKSADIWNSFRQMFHNHEALLYYQSIYNTPRWYLLTKNTPVLEWGRWVAEVGKRYAPPKKR